MIPVRDSVRSKRFPIVNILLIIVNVVIFLYEISMGGEREVVFKEFGIIPSHFLSMIREGDIISAFFPVLSSMFLHGNVAHLVGNMWFLWIFGDNVEDRMGHFMFLVFYIICGISAALIHIYIIHIYINRLSHIPTIGASGAIAGVLGAYFILYPFGKVVALVPVGFFLTMMQLPAVLFLGIWFLIQFFLGGLHYTFGVGDAGGIAWWAHIGGFLAGAILVFFFSKRG